MAYSMDYISDKQLYRAVMYACSLMKPPYNKNYSDAIGISARTYNCKYEDIQHYVSQRSGRKKGKNLGTKYKYYIVGLFTYADDHDSGHRWFNKVKVVKAKDLEHANKITGTNWKGYVCYKEWGESFDYYRNYMNMEFSTNNEANNYLQDNEDTIKKYFKEFEY